MTAEATKNRRRRLIQLIHIGKAKLGWDEAAYRCFLAGAADGVSSCADMTIRQLERALGGMRRCGFVTHHAGRVREEERGSASLEQLEYIKGMWRKCARNKSDAALGAMIKRIAHVDSIRFLDKEKARDVILALRDMMRQAGCAPEEWADA